MKRIVIALSMIIGFGRFAVADEIARIAVLDQLQAQFSVCTAFYMIELRCNPASAGAVQSAEALASAI
jgi:hypothetical protein